MSRPGDRFKIVHWLSSDVPDKRAFFKTLGYKPHAAQENIHGALDLCDTVIACCGARFGKSFAAAAEMVYEMMLPRKEAVGWVVAPTHVLADIIFDQVLLYLQEFFRSNPGALTVRRTDGELVFPNLGGGRSRIFRKTTFDAEGKGTLTGMAVDMLVLDEAAKISSDSIWYNELSTRVIDRGGKVLMISTPMGQRGFFPTLFRMGQDPMSDVLSLRLPSWSNPHIPAQDWEKIRASIPARAWEQEYAARFVSAEGNVFDELMIQRAARGTLEEPQPGVSYAAGLDLALADDYTVLLIFRLAPRPRLVRALRLRKVPTEEQVRKVAKLLRYYNQAPVAADATGMGRPFWHLFLAEGVEVKPIHWTVQSKSNMIRHALLLFEQDRVDLPMEALCPELIHELCSYEWKRSGNYEVGEAPSGQHDDFVAATLMGLTWIPGASGDGRSSPSSQAQQDPGSRVASAQRIVPEAGFRSFGSGLSGRRSPLGFGN